jgi:hypothetical protein
VTTTVTAQATTDSSGNNNTGIPISSPTLGTGEIGNALTFNTTNYVLFNDASGLGIAAAGDPISISAWIKTSATDACIVSLRNSSGNGLIDFAVGNNGATNAGTGQLTAIIRGDDNAGLNYINSGVNVNDNSWHNVIFTLDASNNMKLYVDGTDTGAVNASGAVLTAGITPTTSTSSVGQDLLNGAVFPFNGSIDDVRIYNRALSSLDVTAIYNQTDLSGGSAVNLTAYLQKVLYSTSFAGSGLVPAVTLRKLLGSKTLSGAGSLVANVTDVPGFSTFDPANKSSLITLSSGNDTATANGSTSTYGSVFGTKSRNSGKAYFEVTLNSSPNTYTAVGIATSAFGTSFYVGGDITTHSWGALCNTPSDWIDYAGASTGAYGSGGIPRSGDIIMVYVDFNVGTTTTSVWFGRNGLWFSSGSTTLSPSAPDYNIGGAGTTVFPVASVGNDGMITSNVTINVGATTFSYIANAPSGVVAWG